MLAPRLWGRRRQILGEVLSGHPGHFTAKQGIMPPNAPGAPMIGPVYHGSSENIARLSFEKSKEFGIHFGTKESASHRGGRTGVLYLKKYMLDINNPLILDDVFNWSLENVLRGMSDKRYISRTEVTSLINTLNKWASENARRSGSSLRAEKNKELRSYLQSKGYDGIQYANKGEAGGTAYIAFEDDQVLEVK
jgi:hypothetical protein